VFDAGTGIRLLGESLRREMPLEVHLFFSHVHWDHIQGFPFFAPAFADGNVLRLYGRADLEPSLEEALRGQMSHPNFPVRLEDLGAQVSFRTLTSRDVVELPSGGSAPVRVSIAEGRHPSGVWAYRVDCGRSSVVYATDTEHGDEVDPALLALARGANVLVYDCMYTPEQYDGSAGTGTRVGWGHSTFAEGAKLAAAAGVETFVLFHHDPSQSDADVRDKELRARRIFPQAVAAYEGLTLSLPG
jgi:phosphoribosyl 1,2-cyclic phosphodiesterase